MIIRRAARFARKIGLNEPFMAKIADIVIENYHVAYPVVLENKELIQETFTAEEKRFAETLDSGFEQLQSYIDELKASQQSTLDGKRAFNLYATLGFPVEITRDILSESGLEVDEEGFFEAMEAHRLASGKGSAFAEMNNLDTELYQNEFARLVESGTLPASGVEQDPYGSFSMPARFISLIADGENIGKANPEQEVSLILNQTPFYLESGGQVSDTGFIRAADGSWEVEVSSLSRPAAGIIAHHGKVLFGNPQPDQPVLAIVDERPRRSTMRNHTATHLLHAALRKVLGDKVHQAGSYVDPERLRFDFNYPHAVAKEDLLKIEALVNEMIAAKSLSASKQYPRASPR